MRALLVLLVATGCGRVGFEGMTADATADTVTGHDEDGDGLPDAIDPCPPIAGDTTDSDGDGVGDACDPHPTTTGDSIEVFSPLTEGTSPFDAGDPFTQEADDILIAGDSTLAFTHPITNGRFEFGFEITALDANPQKQVATGFEGTDPFYFVELNDNDPQHWVAVVAFDATNGYVQLAQLTVPMVHTGRGVQRTDVEAGAAPAFSLTTGWYGELYQASASTLAYTGSTRQRLTFNGVDIRLEYLLVIASP